MSGRGLAERLATYGSLVRFSHTVFSLPFAASALLLSLEGPHEPFGATKGLLLLGCLVCARTSAMAFNRYLDRDVDAQNPRTQAREIPAGKVTPSSAVAFTLVSGGLFVALAFLVSLRAGLCSIPVWLFLLAYSHIKRFWWGSHLWLGISLALAPGAIFVAMGAPISAALLSLMLAVATWVAGFDVLYSLQDEAFDRAHRLHSLPARLGGKRAVWLSRSLHVVSALTFFASAHLSHGGFGLFLGATLVATVLLWEHSLVPLVDERPDLTRLNKAFFDLNGLVSLGYFASVALHHMLR